MRYPLRLGGLAFWMDLSFRSLFRSYRRLEDRVEQREIVERGMPAALGARHSELLGR